MKRLSIRSCALVWVAGSLVANIALADGLIVVHNPPPLPRPHYVFAPLEVKYHHVTVKITDQVAVTEVDQSFFNPNRQRLEGTYLFPIPKGGQIDQFSMDINGKQVQAELLDADKARKIYEEIVRKLKDPALLEYAGQSLFKVRIFPIEPGSEKRIRLKYTQLLRSDGGMVEYLYPLNTEKFSSVPLKSVSVKVVLECTRPLESLYSPSHPVEVKYHGSNKAVIGYEAVDVRPDTDFQLLFSSGSGSEVGLNLLTFNDGSEADGGYFMLLCAPAAQQAAGTIVEKDVVFVLDTSGSMADSGKIDQAKKALLFCLKNLNEGDRFELVRFSTETEPLFDKLVPVNDASLARAEEFVRGLKPIGGTAIEDALTKSLAPVRAQSQKDRPYFVVFLTDGQPTIGSTDDEQIVSTVGKAIGDRAVRIFCFGIGTDINTRLLDKLSEKTRAVSQYVLPTEDIEIKVSSFYAKINSPVLANLKLKLSGEVRIAKTHPAALPDLFKGEQLAVFGRYTGAGNVAITLEGTVNGRFRSFTHDAHFAKNAAEHGFIPRLWATRRVGFLLDQIRLHGDSRELRDEVTVLARKFGIVTPYTAYLIVEDESRRNVPLASRTLQAIDRDEEVRGEVSRMYGEAKKAWSGDAAVGSSQAMGALRTAINGAGRGIANSLARRGQRGAAAVGGERVLRAIQSQQNRYVRGRMFYQNGAQWIDAQVQSRQDARKVQLKFNSEEYFALLSMHADAAQWLSVGRNVQLLLDDTIYEVVE
ncbi:MAG: VIT domain-containing protein [Phycisphaerae bacterium]